MTARTSNSVSMGPACPEASSTCPRGMVNEKVTELAAGYQSQ